MSPSLILLAALSTSAPAAEPATSCQRLLCAGTTGKDAAACAEQACSPVEETWVVQPTRIHHDTTEHLLTVAATISHTPASWGPVVGKRDREAYVGVTAFTTEGEALDLSIQTLFPGAFDADLIFSAPMEDDVTIERFIIGVWDEKITPCDDERPGCKEFGLVLDKPLASWPPRYYEGTNVPVPRLHTGTVHVQPLIAGPFEPLELLAAEQRLRDYLKPLLRPSGAELVVLPPLMAEERQTHHTVLHMNEDDRRLAEQAALALAPTSDVDLLTWRAEPESLVEDGIPVVAQGGDQALTIILGGVSKGSWWKCARRKCDDHPAACAEEICPVK